MENRVGIIGGGFVGRAVARGFLEHSREVRIFDTDPARATHSLRETWQSDFVFVCVPTPAMPDGKPNCSIVTAAIHAYAELAADDWPREIPKPAIVIRSTVRPGFTAFIQRLLLGRPGRKTGVVHSPEFLTARCAHTDFATPARNIIGMVRRFDFKDAGETGDAAGMNGHDAERRSAIAATLLRKLYEARFPGVPVQMMTSTESEITKLAMNAFFACKVDFFNLLKQICDAANADFETVRGGMLSDGRIAHAHTAVPGPSGGYGFGGACLPKDLLSLLTFGNKFGIAGELLRAAHEHNLSLRPDDATLPRPTL